MRMMTFAKRCMKEILRDPLTLGFGLGFPLVLLALLSAMQANIPVNLFEINTLTPGITVFGLSFMTLFSATLIAKDRETSLLQRLYIDIFRLLSKDKISDMDNTFDDSKHSRYYQIEMWFADNFAKQVSEDDLASEISISKRHLSRVISDIYGMSFREKLVEVRLHRAAQLLEQTDFNVDKIALAVGYRSFSGFLRAFVDFFGCTPHQYRKNR